MRGEERRREESDCKDCGSRGIAMLAAIGLVGQPMPQKESEQGRREDARRRGRSAGGSLSLRHYLRFPLAVFDELPNGIGQREQRD